MVLFGGRWRAAALAYFLGLALVGSAEANPALVVDVDSGGVLYQSMATAPWYPASLTKLMTTYVALSAVREGKITLDTPLMVSPRAAGMAPSKMGFRPGTLVTLDNALKMLMVKSPNDIAVTIAEGIGGSVEGFAEMMNNHAARLGLQESHFVNPNGLPDPDHFSSARDMAIIARSLLREFPEEHDLFGIGDLAFGGRLIRNHNNLLGRYPGIDGMKTGFTCSAGFNVVLSAERNGRRLITVVLGAPSVATRSQLAASLFDRYFSEGGSSIGQLASLSSSAPGNPPDLRSTICGRGRAGAIAEVESEIDEAAPASSAPVFPFNAGKNEAREQANTAPATTGPNVMQLPRAAFVPVRVFIGPVEGWTGPIAHARDMRPDATDVAAAPSPRAQVMANAQPEPFIGGPKEAAAPAPLALLGATAPLPQTLAATGTGKKARPLSLRVHTARKPRIHAVDPKLAAGTTPSIIAGFRTTPAAAKGGPKRAAHAPVVKGKVKPAQKASVTP